MKYELVIFDWSDYGDVAHVQATTKADSEEHAADKFRALGHWYGCVRTVGAHTSRDLRDIPRKP